jgi:RHH-type transcriptional regulator, proline utilization regulon repressor / proline dehydrogenase / delta 1-pyrroline-5-carboxylate dehydrogenase
MRYDRGTRIVSQSLLTQRRKLRKFFLADEEAQVETLLQTLTPALEPRDTITARARALISVARGQIDLFQHLQQIYDLSGSEGALLLGLAEALPRIPDPDTATALLRDTLARGRWRLGHAAHGPWSSAVAWAFALATTLTTTRKTPSISQRINAAQLKAARYALRKLAHRFVFAETISAALQQAQTTAEIRYSFDMLGEAAITPSDAERYFDAYLQAIEAVSVQHSAAGSVSAIPAISVKLSALSPRYEISKRARVMTELMPKLLVLAKAARRGQVQLTVDAEEAERLELSLDLFERVYRDPDLADWSGLGLAVQAYQKRALPLIDWLVTLAQDVGKAIPVRLVKGAYWDTEVKRAQQGGYREFPVYTRKAATDLSYLVCAQSLLRAGANIIPQFATHNAHTIAFLLAYRDGRTAFEFQRLHGMGEAIYAEVLRTYRIPCRVYAPVGPYDDLLPYLIRRLLENGANSSFVNQVPNTSLSVDSILQDPTQILSSHNALRNPKIVLPSQQYQPERLNSRGYPFADSETWEPLMEQIDRYLQPVRPLNCRPLIAGQSLNGQARAIHDPSAIGREIGTVHDADSALADLALNTTDRAFANWSTTNVTTRAEILERAATCMDTQTPALVSALIREAGKCLPDAIAEVREAIDLLRYYASEARRLLSHPRALPGPSGELNSLSLLGRGVFLCISPWNFPLAIFLGQVAAALVSGNTVIAKPAEQTSLVAGMAVQLLLDADLPPAVIALLPGDGAMLCTRLLTDTRLAGVCFTGSTTTAKQIQRNLANNSGPIIPFIAETGGINTLIADSSAHPEQLVQEVVWSAFNSAGQRCSALRLLIVQEDIATHVLELLAGMIGTLELGDPALPATDIGPVIDATALATLQHHRQRLEREGRCIATALVPETLTEGYYFAPCAYEIPAVEWLQEEVFGPILHVVRYQVTDLERVIDAVNSKGYGLTFGIHSRIGGFVDHLQRRVRAGNVYVNRNMIGAVVGTQPFGGEGLSGTGPKAGGPNYLIRFTTERTTTINTAAVGGDTRLLGDAG